MEETEKQRLCGLMKESLRECYSYYSENHFVDAGDVPGKIWVGYASNGFDIRPLGHNTRFDLNLSRDLCEVAQIAVEESLRGQGHGRELMAAIENFSRRYGCSTIELGATPQSAPFYLKIGFDIKTPLGAMVKQLI